MCGISGIINFSSKVEKKEIIQSKKRQKMRPNHNYFGLFSNFLQNFLISLIQGFSLDLYADDSFSIPLATDSDIFIGAQIFAETSWSVTSLIGQISYLVSDCVVQVGKV